MENLLSEQICIEGVWSAVVVQVSFQLFLKRGGKQYRAQPRFEPGSSYYVSKPPTDPTWHEKKKKYPVHLVYTNHVKRNEKEANSPPRSSRGCRCKRHYTISFFCCYYYHYLRTISVPSVSSPRFNKRSERSRLIYNWLTVKLIEFS